MRKPFTLYPRKSKKGTIWYVQFRLADGTRTSGRSTGCTTRKRAEIWAYENVKENKIYLTGRRITFREFAGEDFFAWDSPWALDKRSGGKRLSIRHCLESTSILAKHVMPAIGHMYLTEIDEDIVASFRINLYQKGYSASLNNKALALIKAVLRAARRKKLIAAVPEMERAGNHSKQRGVLTLEEMRKIFSVEWTDYRGFVANFLAAATGMRLGEIQGLTIQDINIEDRYINVWRTWEKRTKTLKVGTKNGRSRVVVIPPAVARELARLIEINPDRNNPESFVFYGIRKTGQPIDNHLATATLYDAMEKIGITEARRRERILSFHSWRAFFNSLCINSGIPTAKTQAQLGHLTLSMTEKVYYRPDAMEDIRELQERTFLTSGEVH